MLSVPGNKVPRKVTIKVARAENLRESMKDGKKKPNNKFKVMVIGGKKKESSNTEVGTNGNVQWTFTTIIKLHRNQTEPLVLLVEDSDGHHKGQVIIPIVKILPKPYVYSANQDPATSTNIICSELEPTSKCSNPSGFLLYWIWIEEYLAEGDVESGKKSFNKSMSSLFGSKSKLGGSKTNLEIKNSDSISNFSSITSLNKPEKHKTSSLLKLKIGGKKKSKPSLPEAKITPDSSEIDSMSNFSFNMENDNNFHKRDHESTNRHNSFGAKDNINPPMGNPNIVLQNYSKDNKPEGHDINIGGKIETSPSPNKYHTMNVQDISSYKDRSLTNEVSPPFSQNDFEPGHKSKIGSDYSLFSDRGNNKALVDELENIKMLNAELKVQNSKYNRQVYEYEKELNDVKQQVTLHIDEIERIKHENAAHINELANIRKENAELKEENSKFNRKIYEFQSELDVAKQQCRSHIDELANVRKENEELKEENNKLNSSIDEYENKLDAENQRIQSLVDNLQSIKLENSELKLENSKFNDEISQYRMKLETAEQQALSYIDESAKVRKEIEELKEENSKFNHKYYENQNPYESANQQFRFNSEEFEIVRREIAELKVQNNKYNQQIYEYQNELESIKQTLCKLRLRLLEDGATKYLEI